jgi:hypothetical protein
MVVDELADRFGGTAPAIPSHVGSFHRPRRLAPAQVGGLGLAPQAQVQVIADKLDEAMTTLIR